MSTPFADYFRIKRVNGFAALLATPLSDGINALCWERALPGNFAEVARVLGAGEGIVAIDEARLRALPVSAAGQIAVEVMLTDLRLLRDQGRSPELNCVYGYPRDEDSGAVPTDVYSFHADRAPVEADTWLCTYHGLPSEGLRNEDARRKVDDAAIRSVLLKEFGGAEGDDFRTYLEEGCYDLHYAAAREARPYAFGVGHLWRIAVEWPGNPVPPCIHRAPETPPGAGPRLLLIS